jgi:hypothetical protein
MMKLSIEDTCMACVLDGFYEKFMSSFLKLILRGTRGRRHGKIKRGNFARGS